MALRGSSTTCTCANPVYIETCKCISGNSISHSAGEFTSKVSERYMDLVDLNISLKRLYIFYPTTSITYVTKVLNSGFFFYPGMYDIEAYLWRVSVWIYFTL